MGYVLNFQVLIMRESITENIKKVRERIAIAAKNSGRSESDIQIVAVSKLQPVEKIITARQAGIEIFGENRVQELLAKMDSVKQVLRWHLVGHLQSNKVNKIIGSVEMIQSVDSLPLIEKLASSAKERTLTIKVLLQVNTSGEASKYGFEDSEVFSACELVEKLSHIEVKGLMTIGPLTDNIKRIIKSFAALRNLSQQIAKSASEKINMTYLSMGMSGDYELAIEEGSNLVRIGTAIFGART